jgi:hypothetical protein
LENAMSLQSSTMFEKYFRLFEGNGKRGQRYQVILSTGKVYSGVPVATSGSDDSGSFTVTLDTGKLHEVKWNRLLTASPI